MKSLSDLTHTLQAGCDLSPEDVVHAANVLTEEYVALDEKKNFLAALSHKGESVEEIVGFAKVFRSKAIDPGLACWSGEAIDIVGTGGDHTGAFNISSMVVLTLAAQGAKVIKHGNRGITSKCGSADLLAGLGVNLEASAEKIAGAMETLGYSFLFAPAYHPAFRHIVPARKALAAEGKRSIFNILGPLINPGRPANIILGVFSESWVSKLAGALEQLGTAGGLAVHGRISETLGVDELTTATSTRVRGVGRLAGLDEIWAPGTKGLPAGNFDELIGGDIQTNLSMVEAILAGQGPQSLVDTIILNAATALWVCGRNTTLSDGIVSSREALLGGGVAKLIQSTREFYSS